MAYRSLLFFKTFCIGFAVWSAPLVAKEVTLTILTVNDVYECTTKNGYGGLSELMTMLKGERNAAEHYLTTVNGDFLSPSLISGVFHGSHMIDLFNLMEVDVVVFGNHEFDFGVEVLSDRMNESRFCWLGSNVFTAVQREAPFNKAQSSVMFDVDGIKIGMIGLCTTETNKLVQNLPQVTFTPVILSAQGVVHRLKNEGADVIIALTHQNFDEDLQLAKEVPEIDLILGGHDHDVMTWYNGRTFIHKSGHDAQFLGRVDLIMDKKVKGDRMRTTIYPSWKMVPNHGFEKDAKVAERVAFYADKVDAELSHQIAFCEASLDSSNVRANESTMGNLIADAMRHSCNADAALLNGGSIRGNRLYMPGTAITKKDIQEELPFGDVVVLLEVTGEQLLSALENSLNRLDQNAGSFPQTSGMHVVYNSANVLGDRVCEVEINGERIDVNKTYRLATNDYLYRGGDGNTSLSRAKVLMGPGIGPLLTHVVVEYLTAINTVTIGLESRILDCNIALNIKQGNSSGRRIHFN